MEGLGLMNSLFAKSDIILNETTISNINYNKDVKKPFIEILNESMIISKNDENSSDVKTVFENMKNKSRINNVNEASEENIDNITKKIDIQFKQVNLDEKNILIENQDDKLENISKLKEKINTINSKIEIEELNSSIIDSVENIVENLEKIDFSNEKINNLEKSLEKIYEKYSKNEEKIDEFNNIIALVQIDKAFNLVEKYIENEVKNGIDLDSNTNDIDNTENIEFSIENTKNRLENFLNKLENFKKNITSKITDEYENTMNSDEYANLVKDNIYNNFQFVNSEHLTENEELTENSNDNIMYLKKTNDTVKIDKLENLDNEEIPILEKIKEEIPFLQEFISKIEEDEILLNNNNEITTPVRINRENYHFANEIQYNKNQEKENLYSDNSNLNFQKNNNVNIVKIENNHEKSEKNEVVSEGLSEKQILNTKEIVVSNKFKDQITTDNNSNKITNNDIIGNSNENILDLNNINNVISKDNIDKKEEIYNFDEVKFEKNSDENSINNIINNKISDTEEKIDIESVAKDLDISNKIEELLVKNNINGKIEIIPNDNNSKIGLNSERDISKGETSKSKFNNEDIAIIPKDISYRENIIQLKDQNNEIEIRNNSVIKDENYVDIKNMFSNVNSTKIEKLDDYVEKIVIEEKKNSVNTDLNEESRLNVEKMDIKQSNILNDDLIAMEDRNKEVVIYNTNNEELVYEVKKDITIPTREILEKKSTKEINKSNIKNHERIENSDEILLNNSENNLKEINSLESNKIEKKISSEKINLDNINETKTEEKTFINEKLTTENELTEEKDNKFNEFLSKNIKYGLKKVEKREEDTSKIGLNNLEEQIKLEGETSPLSFVDKMPKRYSTEVLEQIKNGINIDISNLKKEMKIKLTPDDLGEVEVKLSLENSIMKAEFIVQNEKVKEILETRFNELKNNLIEKGIENPEININVSSENSDNKDKKYSMKENEKDYKRKRNSIKTIENSAKIVENKRIYRVDNKVVNILY